MRRARGDMADLQVILIGILSTCILTLTEATNHLCASAGGRCMNRYEGCQDGGVVGKIVDGLCDGPLYYQCCVVVPVIDLEALNRPKWRHCYQCTYAISRGRQLGELDCMTWGRQSAELPTVNCTGMCSKELLTLDQDNFELVRRCSQDCHQDNRNVHCCWGDLCNHAPGGATGHAALLPLVAAILVLWRHLGD